MTPALSDLTFSFTLRDRYGNIAPENLIGSITRDTDPPRAIVFSSGMYSEARTPGYYTLRSDALSKNTISYSDARGSYTLTGISFATLYVPPTGSDFSFLPDYNARYTILAGESFLRQGEQILYDVTPGASSSLAVSTLLDSPYRQPSLLSVLPGGAIHLGSLSDSALTPTVTLEKNTLIVTVRDDVSHTDIARIGYPVTDTTLSLCHEKDVSLHTCETDERNPRIEMITFETNEYTG